MAEAEEAQLTTLMPSALQSLSGKKRSSSQFSKVIMFLISPNRSTAQTGTLLLRIM